MGMVKHQGKGIHETTNSYTDSILYQHRREPRHNMSAPSFCSLRHDLLCVHACSGHIPLHASQRPGKSRFRTARPRSISRTY